MNFLDPYDIAQTPTPPSGDGDAAATPRPEPTLNEEINQVVGQLGRLWGGFRRQSQTALETARKDLSQVASTAQKELSKYIPADAALASGSSQSIAEEPQSGDSTAKASTEGSEDPRSSTSTETTGPTAGTSSGSSASQAPASPSQASSPFQSVFSRLQASLPPNISSTLQANIPQSLRDAAAGNVNVDFAQLKTNLTTEFQRVQGVTRSQAEEYVHKSEALLKEASEFLKDAVKVIPPDDADADDEEGRAVAVWDGTDIWTMPPIRRKSAAGSSADAKGKKAERDEVIRKAAAGTRVDALLQKLRQDKEVVSLDPCAEERVKAVYENWVQEKVASEEGGIEGKIWKERIQGALDGVDGGALKGTRDALVPENMDSQTFWTRYFFRVHQIEQDEERRKALLAAAPNTEEDFSWEDDEDDDSATPPGASSRIVTSTSKESATSAISSTSGASAISTFSAVASNVPSQPSSGSLPSSSSQDVQSLPTSQSHTPATASPRESSEGSYDVVGTASGVGTPAETAGEEEGEGDSDWE